MAPVINIFKQDSSNFKTLVAVTAQHREMLDQVLDAFNIIPDYDFDLMAKNQTLGNLTTNILSSISDTLSIVDPDIIFVQGDTTTTFATSLASFYQKIPVGHIEAGLRTNNKYSPFPEEINRRITTQIASYHFPPTEQAKMNLLHEGIKEENITVTGNTVIDALLSISENSDNSSDDHIKRFSNLYGISFKNIKTILVTGHRRESFGEGFENICYAIKYLAEGNKIQFIFPVHLNPSVQEPVNRILGDIKNVYLIPPQEYVPFVLLMKNAHIILTDSGGIQEEAPALGKPVLVMRDVTERQEGVKSGTARLVGTDKKRIICNVELLINNQSQYDIMAKAANPYGNGKASLSILKFIKNKL